jgi:hypothetical protein
MIRHPPFFSIAVWQLGHLWTLFFAFWRTQSLIGPKEARHW